VILRLSAVRKGPALLALVRTTLVACVVWLAFTSETVPMMGEKLLAPLLARGIGDVLLFLGADARVLGTIVDVSGFCVQIDWRCTGILQMVGFIAAVLVTPARPDRRAFAVAVGVAGITALNLVRILTIIWTGIRFPTLVPFLHDVFWEGLMILWTAGLWLWWYVGLRSGR
jgi:exosortase/archaeosortase family protein